MNVMKMNECTNKHNRGICLIIMMMCKVALIINLAKQKLY